MSHCERARRAWTDPAVRRIEADFNRFPDTHEIGVSDPEDSVFHRQFADRGVTSLERGQSGVEGIGRPRVEPSFSADVIERRLVVRAADSIAAACVLSEQLGRLCAADR